jgi:uncharacterized membrane protein YfcA
MPRPAPAGSSELTPEEQPSALTAKGGLLAASSGLVTGAAAGLIGVGGGEFRIPVLLHLLGMPVRLAAGVNMAVGLCTVALSLARRWGQHEWSVEGLAVALVMAAFSVPGALLGARYAHWFPSSALKKVVCAYLAAVGAWMVFEALARADHTLLELQGPAGWAVAAAVGFAVALASGGLGVAGGEMRIPALLYLFAMPVKEAGTVSLLASVPTVAAGAAAYRRLGHLPNRVLALTALMGLGSVAGVLVGAALVPLVDRHTVKALLGAVLLVAAGCLMLPRPAR